MGLFKNTKSVAKVLEAELQTIYTESSWDEEVQNWLQNEIETQQEEVDDNEMYSKNDLVELEKRHLNAPINMNILGDFAKIAYPENENCRCSYFRKVRSDQLWVPCDELTNARNGTS